MSLVYQKEAGLQGRANPTTSTNANKLENGNINSDPERCFDAVKVSFFIENGLKNLLVCRFIM